MLAGLLLLVIVTLPYLHVLEIIGFTLLLNHGKNLSQRMFMLIVAQICNNELFK